MIEQLRIRGYRGLDGMLHADLRSTAFAPLVNFLEQLVD